MKRVGTYIWDHMRGRHHIGRSIINAVVAYVGVMAIPLTLTYLFLEPLNWYLIGEAATIARITLIWGGGGVVWSAVRTARGKNEASPTARFISISILVLLAAAMVGVTVLDAIRIADRIRAS